MCADGITGVVRGQGQQGYVEINACEQQQPTRWRWLWGIGLSGPQPPPDCSLGREVEWMATTSGSQSAGYCPMDSGNSPLGPAAGKNPAWHRSPVGSRTR